MSPTPPIVSAPSTAAASPASRSAPLPPVRHGPETRRAATRNPYSPVMLVATVVATLGILTYGWFLLNPAHRGDVLPWTLVIVAEVVLVFHALMAMWTVLAGQRDPRGFAFHTARRELYGDDARPSPRRPTRST